MALFLPDQTPVINLVPYLDLRERLERRINRQFNSAADDNRSDLLSRYRPGLDISASGTGFSAKFEYQYAHDLFWTAKGNASTWNSDLSLGYVKYQAPKDWWAQVGRQKIEIGQQRLIGPAEWTTLARSFDAVRIGDGQWDVWAGKLGVANTKPETAKIATLTHTDKTWGQGSLIYKHDVAPKGDIDIETLDYVVNHPIGKGTADAEAALQFGDSNGKTQQAWAAHLRYRYPILSKTTLGAELNSASGGSTADTNRTFDNLYPSNHGLYGLADLTAWRNMNDLSFEVQNEDLKNLTLKAQYHILSLRDASDGWYNATGGINPRVGGSFIDPTGASGKQLGNELDLIAAYKTKRWGTFQAGIAFFDPGNFVKNLSSVANQQIYGYLQYQIVLK